MKISLFSALVLLISLTLNAQEQVHIVNEYYGETAKKQCENDLSKHETNIRNLSKGKITIYDIDCLSPMKKIAKLNILYNYDVINRYINEKLTVKSLADCNQSIKDIETNSKKTNLSFFLPTCTKLFSSKNTHELKFTYIGTRNNSLTLFDNYPEFSSARLCQNFIDAQEKDFNKSGHNVLSANCTQYKRFLSTQGKYYYPQILLDRKKSKMLERVQGPAFYSSSNCQKSRINVQTDIANTSVKLITSYCLNSSTQWTLNFVFDSDLGFNRIKKFNALDKTTQSSCMTKLQKLRETLKTQKKEIIYSYCQKLKIIRSSTKKVVYRPTILYKDLI